VFSRVVASYNVLISYTHTTLDYPFVRVDFRVVPTSPRGLFLSQVQALIFTTMPLRPPFTQLSLLDGGSLSFRLSPLEPLFQPSKGHEDQRLYVVPVFLLLRKHLRISCRRPRFCDLRSHRLHTLLMVSQK